MISSTNGFLAATYRIAAPEGVSTINPIMGCEGRTMKKSLFILEVILLSVALAGQSNAKEAGGNGPGANRMQWWTDARFGMFIHWGIYSVPAKGEWYMSDGHVARARYEEYAKQFDPVDFNADRWVKLAHDAGMRYLVITSKHHDGFCMFNTKATRYNVVDATPWGKNPLKALSEACRKYGVRFCVYYSIMDWHSPDQGAYKPSKDDPTYNPTHFKPGKKAAYMKYMKTQLKELISQYHPGVIWFDGGWMDGWTKKDGREIYDYLRKLDPEIIVNNRAGVGDYETPEQYIPPDGIRGHDWETCMTINNDWGYNASDLDFKTAGTLIRNLVDIVSKGGNYLLNVGPTAKGVIPRPEVDRLQAMGRWLRTNGDAIYDTKASPFSTQLPWGRCTSKGDKLYLEVFRGPADGRLVVKGLYTMPVRTFVLGDKQERDLRVERDGDDVAISLPSEVPDTICSVIELVFKSSPVVYNPPVISSDARIFLHTMDLSIGPRTSSAELRYTVDGSVPTAESPAVVGNVRLRNTATVTARLFRNGQPVSEVSRETFTKVSVIPAVGPTNIEGGLRFRYYQGEWDSMPDFRSLVPVREGTLPSFSLPDGKATVNFGVEYSGYVLIPAEGVYTLSTASDDGSMLCIGDSLVVDNNGLHGLTEQKGVVALAKEYHPITVDYFQRACSDSLAVYMKGPGVKKALIPASQLFCQK